MKKTYQNPTLVVIRIETQQMLAGSTTMTINREETTDTFDARGFDFDDEE